MATQPANLPFDIEEQRTRINRAIVETEKLAEEARKLQAEAIKLAAEERKLNRDKSLSPWLLLAQGLIAGAALMGAIIALLK